MVGSDSVGIKRTRVACRAASRGHVEPRAHNSKNKKVGVDMTGWWEECWHVLDRW
jgi:hypothetical protein